MLEPLAGERPPCVSESRLERPDSISAADMIWRINEGKKFHTVLRDGWAATAVQRAISSDPHAGKIIIIVAKKASAND
jgi:hypothetical protein